jgi:hypothetical protein
MFNSKHLVRKRVECSICGLFQGTITQIVSTAQKKRKTRCHYYNIGKKLVLYTNKNYMIGYLKDESQ